MDAAIKGEYHYPHTIVFVPGLSCMYKCTFCGRNYDAKFEKEEKYYEVYRDVIYQNKGRGQINIGGGLEPMTSPYLNQICKDLYDVGMKSRMITNGFMLTQNYIKKNPYVANLDTLRISLYGIDEEEYSSVSRNKKGYHIVKNNLKLLDRKVKLNYVLLPQNFTKLNKILDYIDDIGGIDELSLREDFSFQYEINDRNKFQDILNEFDMLSKQRGVKVHYGYAMYDLLRGRKSKLIKCDFLHLDKKQSPQTKIYLDPNGDLYYYSEAAFLNRKDSERHILGNTWKSSIDDALKDMKEIEPRKDDIKFMDTLTHLIEYYKWSIRNV